MLSTEELLDIKSKQVSTLLDIMILQHHTEQQNKMLDFIEMLMSIIVVQHHVIANYESARKR
ncbi:unnamed protein product [marine sediment metagenome]|uniref:Uncharacterized protein n=1 Tax=marine sediment metagenome TaxID=412755 RepID=X1PH93_9ZZZZ